MRLLNLLSRTKQQGGRGEAATDALSLRGNGAEAGSPAARQNKAEPK